MNWNGIAPFNEPCKLAPAWPMDKYSTTVKYVLVNGTCDECKQTFTRTVSSGNASRVNICGSRECKRSRQSKLNKRSEMRKRERKAGRLLDGRTWDEFPA